MSPEYSARGTEGGGAGMAARSIARPASERVRRHAAAAKVNTDPSPRVASPEAAALPGFVASSEALPGSSMMQTLQWRWKHDAGADSPGPLIGWDIPLLESIQPAEPSLVFRDKVQRQ